MSSLRFAAGLLLLGAVASAPAVASPYTGLYVLGDSLSDQGNLLQATTALGPSYGPAQPDPLHYYMGRFSNGPIYAETLAADLGLSLTASQSGGTNFAFGGARTDYNTVEVPPYGTQVYPHNAYPWSLNGEVAAFNAQVASTGADPNALYVVFSGSNDITDIIARGKPAASTIQNTLDAILSAIDAFKAAGAKTVLVPNLPDLGVTPRVTSLEGAHPGISAAATALITTYNAALDTALNQETGIQIVRFDTFEFLDDVVADPQAYGFTNATSACYNGFVAPNPTPVTCSDPAGYVFWDVEHPTTAFHTLLGNAMYGAVLAAPEPSSLGLALAGLATLAGLRHLRRTARTQAAPHA